ncbi:hypothetical protein GCM10023223_44530 [Stackebrandtia albiflava]
MRTPVRRCVIHGMTILCVEPRVDALTEIAEALATWQHDDTPMQLHPGDLGWFRRFGPETAAAAVRTWSRDGRILAVGLLDEPALLRLTTAPEARRDDELAARIASDLAAPGRVLPAGKAYVEVPVDARLRELLSQGGWADDESRTPLRHDLTEPVADPGLRIAVAGPGQVSDRVTVQRAAFESSTFTEERWHAMAAGPRYTEARCLVGYDDEDTPVAAVTVWSAGPGRPGLIEPMGVHRDHRGRGHGTAITVAAAAALREMGASTAIVCTGTGNTGAVATYRAAGFRPLPEVRDLRRD